MLLDVAKFSTIKLFTYNKSELNNASISWRLYLTISVGVLMILAFMLPYINL